MEEQSGDIDAVIPPDELEPIISPARFATFITLANGDPDLAVELYTWTGRTAGALFTDFRTLEVAYRNLIDRAMTTHITATKPNSRGWMHDRSWLPAGGHWWDRPADQAIRQARRRAGGSNAAHGAIVAELSFGFWRYTISGRYEESFWNTALDDAFTGIAGHSPGDRRQRLEQTVINLHALRNRLAHHEPILKPWTRRIPGGATGTFTLNDLYDDLVQVLDWITPATADRLLQNSRVPNLLATKPKAT